MSRHTIRDWFCDRWGRFLDWLFGDDDEVHW